MACKAPLRSHMRNDSRARFYKITSHGLLCFYVFSPGLNDLEKQNIDRKDDMSYK